jgi:hypothetical protein
MVMIKKLPQLYESVRELRRVVKGKGRTEK